MAVYGYLRVSTDEQDSNSQKQGVEKFARERGLKIDAYVTDDGVSGAKDPSKRKLGGLLKKLGTGDIVIASEISRLGRDLFMIMDILHLCMKKGVKVLTVKDGYELGDNIQSKVLAFAFGLAAEIERQLIRQRTAEGLKLRKQMGVLIGRPPRVNSRQKSSLTKEPRVLSLFQGGLPIRQIAKVVKIDRGTVARILARHGLSTANIKIGKKTHVSEIEGIDHDQIESLILNGCTLPDIHRIIGGNYDYTVIYEYVANDTELNILYRKNAQKKLLRDYIKNQNRENE